MKVKLFSHSDLDGISCGIVGKLAFPDINIEYCDYDNVNEKIKQYIEKEEYKNYETTFITDISVNGEVAELIDNVYEFVLLDHHKTALWLNKYKWACVAEYLNEEDNIKHSGTAMFYYHILDFVIGNKLYSKQSVLKSASDFVEIVRQYDTWEFQTKYNNLVPKQVNDLMYLIGRDAFIEKVTHQILTFREFNLTEEDFSLLKRNQETIDKYIESKDKSIIVKEIQGYKAGVVFAERYSSELGNKLSELHPELDFIAMINPSHSVSYRTVKKDIDLSLIAGVFGGGGHKQASGSQIYVDMRENIINLIFG